ncbi:hypothetical protein N7450_007885 [Penicillium hetheringtonii]|nr:hypothetical protein N7450_007885 [Penicillium hetheringtonii]
MTSSKSSFFTKLPGEIRNKIYEKAFGGRVIHINLYADLCISDYWPKNGAYDATKTRTRQPLPDTVRYRDPQFWGNSGNQPRLGHWEREKSTAGDGAHIIFDQIIPSRWTTIGVMGWLLSCQQAYAETINIMYSNTFYFAGNASLQDFIKISPQKSLACMKGLIVEPVGLKSNIDYEVDNMAYNTSGISEIELTVSIIGSGIFQNLRELDVKIIDLSRAQFMFARHADNQVQRALAVLDDLIPKMGPRFQRLHIYLEDFLFETAIKMDEGSKKDSSEQHGTLQIHGKQKFWRSTMNPSTRPSGYWIAQDNWRSHYLSLIANYSSGSVSQGLRRLIKF